MTRTIKIKETPRSNARKNWKKKVKRSWKHQKQQDPTAPYLSRSHDLDSTFRIGNYNYDVWKQLYDQELLDYENGNNNGAYEAFELGIWHNWRDHCPTDTELKMVKSKMLEKILDRVSYRVMSKHLCEENCSQ